MYLNIELIKSKHYTIPEVFCMQILKQNKYEDREEEIALYFTDEIFEKFEEKGILDRVKKKKKSDSDFSILRLSKKGSKLLDDFYTAEVDEDTLKIYDWIESIYIRSGKEIGNKKKTKQFIAQFSKESGITRNHLSDLIKSFVYDDSQFEWSKVLQYLFFKGDSVFSIKFDLHASRLYQYYLKNKQSFDKEFENIKN